MKNFVQEGDVITVTAAANLTSGTPFILGAMLAIPVTDIASGADGAAAVEGVFELPKLSTAVIAAGAALTWDVSAGQIIIASAAVGDLESCAVAIAAAGNGTATVLAKLTPGVGAVKAS